MEEASKPSKPAGQDIQPAKDPERATTLEPKVAEAKPAGRATFDVDPIADTGLITMGMGFSAILELINSTGEVRPQQIDPGFDRSNLIGIDRASITSTPDKQAGLLSNVGLFAAVAFAVVDPVLSGLREQNMQTSLVDAMLYAESLSLTFAFTDMVKLAVRRPRPGAYVEAEKNQNQGIADYTNTSTDSALSFFSGHSSMTAAVGATASYLAFTRAPGTPRPWITLGASVAVTSFVSIERVRAGKHFPTDVIAGAIAGAGIGIMVPHLHRTEDVKQRRVWVGYAPLDSDDGAHGGNLTMSGLF